MSALRKPHVLWAIGGLAVELVVRAQVDDVGVKHAVAVARLQEAKVGADVAANCASLTVLKRLTINGER